MDFKSLKQKFKGINPRRLVLVASGGAGAAAILIIVILLASRKSRHSNVPVVPIVAIAPQPEAAKTVEKAEKQIVPPSHGFFRRLANLIPSIQGKADSIYSAEREGERLELENAHLRLVLDAIRFDCHAKDTASATKDLELKLSKETGAKVGRTLASITYRPPGHLLPDQLYTLGVSYFKAREDEKSAVIFTFLTGLEDNSAYKTARNYLMTGVSWYRLDNYELADTYFDQVLRQPETNDSLMFQAQARLWKGLVYDRLGKHATSQYWLRELLDHHPHSTEAEWVNSQEGRSVFDQED